ncbi:SOS response-associated peptidase [Flagellimonas sp.]|uniref:SOS response-associated peptidase n=1 Tax=Flagellimonas sp. TaxID=2058762 RepID=UPI003F49C298
MCYTTAQNKPTRQLELAMEAVAKLPEFIQEEDLVRYHINGFAKQYFDDGKKMSEHPFMLIQPQEDPRFLTPVMWGYVPHWEDGDKIEKYYTDTIGVGSGLNVTSEKLFSSDYYKDSSELRRCIVPVTGFYEPYKVYPNKGREYSIPFHFERRDKEVMKLAGIYEFTKGHNSNSVYVTFGIITKPATPLFAKIHHTKKRRPVILNDEQAKGWLDKKSQQNDLQQIIDTDLPDADIFAQPINRNLYKTSIDTNRPGITEPFHYPEIAIDYENKPPSDLFS